MHAPPRILIVDDIEDNREIIRARLTSQGYAVATANDGEEALAAVAADRPDLVLLDVMMPKLDGVETVKRLKADTTSPFLPVVLLTSKSDLNDVVAGLDAGADEYLTKPVDHAALVARVKAMLRIKALHEQLERQAETLRDQSAELASLNRQLEARVAAQVDEIERISRLKRFLSPQVAEAILASPSGEAALESHRRDVSVLFCDLRGFTAFAETGEPEEVMALLREYHTVVGERIFRHEGTLERFAGDALMVLFNDPIACDEHCRRAVQLGLDIQGDVGKLLQKWARRGAELGVGVGIAAGYATLGRVGFAKRYDYAGIGTVTNLAARLCAGAEPGQILVSRRVANEIEAAWTTRHVGDWTLKGFLKATPVYEVVTAGTP